MMDLLDLSQSDLEANRQGHLSAKQKARLRRKGIAIGLGYGFLSVLFAAFFVYALRDMLHGDANVLLSVIGSGIGTAFITGVTIYKCSQVQQDLIKGKAVSTEGKVSLRVMETRTLRYKLQLGTLELEVPKRVYEELKDGKHYRVYYTPRSRTLLAIEHSH